MAFRQWTEAYFRDFIKKNGPLRGRTMRNTTLAVKRLMPYFGD